METKRFKYVRRRSYLIAILVTLSFLAAGTIFIIYAGNQSRQETLRYISEAVQQSQFNVDSHINEEFQTMNSGMILREDREWLADDDAFDRMTRRLLAPNTYVRIGLVGPDGSALWVDRNGNRARGNLADEPFIQKALAGEPAIAEARWDEEAGINVNDYAIPVYTRDGMLRGAIYTSDPESELRAIVENSLFAGEGFAQIITSSGQYVMKSYSPLRLGGDGGIFDLREPLELSDKQTILANMAAGRAGYLRYGREGEDRLVAYTPSRHNDWYIFYSAPEGRVSAGLQSVVYGAVAVIAIAAGLFLFLILMIRHNNNKSLQELEHLAFVDPVTSGPNLQKFKIEAQKQLYGNPRQQYAVCYIDIKGFKYINDIFGRTVGDQLLCYLSDALKKVLLPGELCARTGGDMFVALRRFGGVKPIERDDMEVAEKLAAFPPTAAQGYKVEAYGGAYLTDPNERNLTLDDMLDRALEAEQEVKRRGGPDRFGFYTNEMRAQKLWDTEVESKMERALKEGEFKMYFQPKIDIQHGNGIMGMEALVRWEPPGRELIQPARFIDLFECNGFIVNLDRYMIEEACRAYRDQDLAALDPPPVLSVNVSRRSLLQPDIVQAYAGVREKYGIPAGLIELEFTEGLLFENHKRFQKVVEGLRGNGFLCSLDDFGAGYSSLNILKSLDVDVLKLDKLFFDYGKNEARGRELVKMVVALAKTLHIKTVAEGIDDCREVEWLREIGCDAIQGYVFSKPFSAEEFREFLAGWKNTCS